MPPPDNPVLDELQQPASRGDLKNLENRLETRFQDVEKRFEHVDDRFDQVDRRFEQVDKRFDELHARFDEVKRHFDVVAEDFRTQFRNLFDWAQTTTTTLGTRLDAIEDTHGHRLTAVEGRVADLETGRSGSRRDS